MKLATIHDGDILLTVEDKPSLDDILEAWRDLDRRMLHNQLNDGERWMTTGSNATRSSY